MFYLERYAYVAAVNRATRVLERYESSPFTEEALAVLVYAYTKLSLHDLAEDNRLVLEHNYPNSVYLGNSIAIFDDSVLDMGS